VLYQGRDLMPTLDLRSVVKGVMQEHLLIPARALDTTVFPDSGAAKALSGLVHTHRSSSTLVGVDSTIGGQRRVEKHLLIPA